MKKERCHKAQSIIEYTVLITIVAMALISMNLYIKRAVNARLHQIELDINPGIIVRR